MYFFLQHMKTLLCPKCLGKTKVEDSRFASLEQDGKLGTLTLEAANEHKADASLVHFDCPSLP